MSSALYAVRVVEVAGTRVQLDVTSVESAGCFSVSRLFALNLLYEPFWNTVYSAPGRRWPGAVEGPLKDAFEEQQLMDEWATGGVPPEEQHRLSRIVDLAYRNFRNVPPLPFPPDSDGGYRSGTAPREFHDAVIDLLERSPRLPPSALPTATACIEVSSPRWVSHLARGMIWDSYVFDENAPILF